MEYYIYKFKNRLFRSSNEAFKIKRPVYEDLIRYKTFKKNTYNKFILGFGAGRSGQDWTAKIFNSHSNWIGSSERFPDFESFYRYVSYYNLPIERKEVFKLFDLASKKDMSMYKNTFIGSPYFAFGVEELFKELRPDFLIFNIRNPIDSVESFHRKGWYLHIDNFELKKPSINISNNLTRSFSRIFPNDEYFNDWIKLSRIGKYMVWATINKKINDSFNNLKNIEKYFIRLEDAMKIMIFI